EDRSGGGAAAPRLRLAPLRLRERGADAAPALARERARQAGRDAERRLRRLDREGAGAAEAVDEGRAGVPLAEREHEGGERLAQHRRAALEAPAAPVEALARGVERERPAVAHAARADGLLRFRPR